MENKKGITMTSIIVYVILFFIFTTTVTIIASNFNTKLFVDRGLSIDTNSLNKLQYNLLMSSEDSNLVDIIGGEINSYGELIGGELVFSNNDSYIYDKDSGVIRKNGGILVSNVIFYSATVANGDNGKLLTIHVKFKKYLHEDAENRVIKVFVEGA